MKRLIGLFAACLALAAFGQTATDKMGSPADSAAADARAKTNSTAENAKMKTDAAAASAHHKAKHHAKKAKTAADKAAMDTKDAVK